MADQSTTPISIMSAIKDGWRGKVPSKDALIAWNGDFSFNKEFGLTCGVKVLNFSDPWLDEKCKPYTCTDGACWIGWNKMKEAERLNDLIELFIHLVVDYQIPGRIAFVAFIEIDGFVQVIGKRWKQHAPVG